MTRDVPFKEAGKVCTVRDVEHDRKLIVSAAEPPRPKEMPTTILEVLWEWGCTWIWKSLRLIGGDHWLENAIEAGTVEL